MRVVIDTNVLVSGLISRSSPPAQIVNAVLRGDIIPVMSHASFAELEEVLHRPRLQSYFRKRGITAEAALDLAKALGTSAKLWMNLQATYDLDQAMKRRKAA